MYIHVCIRGGRGKKMRDDSSAAFSIYAFSNQFLLLVCSSVAVAWPWSGLKMVMAVQDEVQIVEF